MINNIVLLNFLLSSPSPAFFFLPFSHTLEAWRKQRRWGTSKRLSVKLNGSTHSLTGHSFSGAFFRVQDDKTIAHH